MNGESSLEGGNPLVPSEGGTGYHLQQKNLNLPEFEFLASPYYDQDPEIRHDRYLLAEQALASLMKEGRPVFSPIVMCHNLALSYNMGMEARDWWEFNRPFMARASNVIVLCLPGWEESKGVNAEIHHARTLKKSIEYISPDQLTIG